MVRSIWFILLTSVAAVSAAVNIGFRWGWVPGALVPIAFLVLAFLSLRTLRPVLNRNPRGLTLLQAIPTVGLVDIKSRNEGDRHLPPEALYRSPGLKELVITGISGTASFQNHLALIKNALAERKDVYFIVCGEDTPGLDQVSLIEKRNVKREIVQVRGVVQGEKLEEDERFHIKCFSELPTFTAVMINGDLVPRKTPPSDAGTTRKDSARAYRGAKPRPTPGNRDGLFV